MNDHPETERRVVDALTTRSAALESPSPDLDGVWQHLDRRRRRRRGVATLGSVAVVGLGAVGLLSLRTNGSDLAGGPGAAGGTPDQQAAWRCTDQLDYFEEGSPALFFATCEQVTFDGSVPVGGLPDPTIPIDPSRMMTTTVPMLAPTTEPVDETWYAIRDGDTFESIAETFGTTPEEIARLNRWPDLSTERIQPGNEILVGLEPTAAPTTTWDGVDDPPTTSPRTPLEQKYVIRAGDSLGAIADRFDVTLEQLLNYNEFPDGASHLILPGDVIMIPPGGVIAVPQLPATTPTTSTSVP